MIISLILAAALLPLLGGLLWARWRDPYRIERQRALRAAPDEARRWPRRWVG